MPTSVTMILLCLIGACAWSFEKGMAEDSLFVIANQRLSQIDSSPERQILAYPKSAPDEATAVIEPFQPTADNRWLLQGQTAEREGLFDLAVVAYWQSINLEPNNAQDAIRLLSKMGMDSAKSTYDRIEKAKFLLLTDSYIKCLTDKDDGSFSDSVRREIYLQKKTIALACRAACRECYDKALKQANDAKSWWNDDEEMQEQALHVCHIAQLYFDLNVIDGEEKSELIKLTDKLKNEISKEAYDSQQNKANVLKECITRYVKDKGPRRIAK